VAAAINQAGTGVQASAITQFVLGADDAGSGAAGFAQGSTYTFDLSSDTSANDGSAPSHGFTTVSFTTGGINGSGAATSTDQLNTAAQAFNDASGKTGFTATVVKTDNGQYGLEMTSSTGKDLRITADKGNANTVSVEDTTVIDGDKTTASAVAGKTVTATAKTGVWAAKDGDWITGQVILDSSKSFSATDSTGLFMLAKTAEAGQLQQVANIDVSTVDAASRSLAMVDSALTAINDQRARYGALENRFTSAVSNLQATSENLSAARSRIQDTDFAAETANLTRNQILQQAGTAMLAQANALPQQVLSLLK
jgi:flagellin